MSPYKKLFLIFRGLNLQSVSPILGNRIKMIISQLKIFESSIRMILGKDSEKDSKIFPYFLDENVHGSLKMNYTFKGLVSLILATLRHLKNYIYFPFFDTFSF